MILLKKFTSGLFKINEYFWVHLLIIIPLFTLIYHSMSLWKESGLLDRERDELSSLGSCFYYATITEFTIGSLNNPESSILRLICILQIVVSFIFLNL